MTGIGSALLGLLMIAVFLLAAGGLHQLVRGRNPRKGVLMLVAAAVMLGNVLVWSL